MLLLFRLVLLSMVLIAPAHAAEASVPSWIWSQQGAGDGEEIYLRKTFSVGKGVEAARLSATADNEMIVFVNGTKVAESTEWERPRTVDIGGALVEGENLIAVKAKNQGAGAAGFLGQITLTTGDGPQRMVSDGSWQFSADEVPNWNTALELAEGDWKPAIELGKAGEGPWAGKIEVRTLDMIQDAKPPEATPAAAIRIKEGFSVELLYSVPMEQQGSWVASCFDDKGRMITSDQYGGLYRITPPPLGGKPEDTQVEPIPVELGEAQGMCYAFGALYVITNSDKYPRGLYRVTDTTRDDMFDKVEVLRLFANSGGEHGPHAVLPGPDGKSLYVVVGNQTPITEMDSSRVPRNWGEDNLLEPPLIGRGFMREVMAPGGWVAKTDPDGKSWELITIGFRNQYDAAFNKDGALFTFDADMEWDVGAPWYRPTRICEVISGGDYGWRALSKKWPVRWEDGLPPVVDIGPGSPTGVTFGYGTTFPQKYQDAFYAADWSYGKLYAVHLKPDGAGYAADAEEFLSANPLPITDLSVNPSDGAMYFLIGGRRVQSGLYRVTAQSPEGPAPAQEAPPLLGLRREIEALHGAETPGAIQLAWQHLAHEDRLIRSAARIALEHQPLAQWADQALAEENPRAALTAIMALCRSGGVDKTLLDPVLEALDRIDFSSLKGIDAITYVRNYQLAFARFGMPEESLRAKTAAKLSAFFPTREPALDVDLAEVLVFLADADFLPKAIEIMERAPTQEEQISYAKHLRLASAGWTPELRERFFTWASLRVPTYKGGASFPMFMEDLKRDAVAGLSEEERETLKPIIEAKPDVKQPQFDYSGREFVKDWKIEDLDPLLAVGLEGGRDFENGRNLFGATACFGCHRFGSEGGAVGPDLTSVAGKYSPRDLLVHILEPDKEISDQYGQLEVTLEDDSKIYGRIMNLSGENLMLNISMMDPNAITTVPRSKIKTMEQSKTSMMPAGLLNTSTDTDILDLLAYLLSQGDRENPLFK